ncbi:PAS domain S-box protein [candidate division WOR-3 bacterium]|nr:PAS domain S-box protein [candidate division WOR-3 bacterium]
MDDAKVIEAVSDETLGHNNHYRSLIDNLPIGIFWGTPEGKITSVNKTLVRLLGYSSREELLAKSIPDVCYNPIELREFVERLASRGAISDYELRLVRKDESVAWTLVSVSAVRGESNKIIRYFGVIQDITNRKQAEVNMVRDSGMFEALYQLSREINRITVHLDDLFVVAADLLAENPQVLAGGIYLLDKYSRHFNLVVSFGPGKEFYSKQEVWSLSNSHVRTVLDSDTAILQSEWMGKEITLKSIGNRHASGQIVSVAMRTGLEVQGILSMVLPSIDQHGLRFVETIGEELGVGIKRRREEIELKEEREKEQRYLDVAGVIILALDCEGKVTLINKMGCKILGYGEEEIVGENWFDNFLPQDARSEVKEAFTALINGKNHPQESYENPVLTKSGEERYIAWHNIILRDEHNNPVGTLSSGTDITSRKGFEEALRESEERYRALTEESLVGVYMLKDNRFIYVNPEMTKITGYRKVELLDMNPWDMVLKEDLHEGVIKQREEAIERGEEVPVEYVMRIKKKDGNIAHLEVRARKVQYRGAWVTLGCCIDITEFIEEKKEEENTRNEWRLVFDSVPDLIMIIDRDGKIVRGNKALSKYTGKTIADLFKKDYLDVLKVDSPGVWINLHKICMDSKQPQYTEVKDKKRNSRFSVVISPLLNRKGEVVGTTDVARYIGNL